MPGISEDIKFNSIKKELKYLQARAQTQERNDWGFSVLHSHDWKKSMGVYQGLVTYGWFCHFYYLQKEYIEHITKKLSERK